MLLDGLSPVSPWSTRLDSFGSASGLLELVLCTWSDDSPRRAREQEVESGLPNPPLDLQWVVGFGGGDAAGCPLAMLFVSLYQTVSSAVTKT